MFVRLFVVIISVVASLFSFGLFSSPCYGNKGISFPLIPLFVVVMSPIVSSSAGQQNEEEENHKL